MTATEMTLAELLPDPHFRERHERRIEAPAGPVWEALHELRLGDLPLSRALMGVRRLPAGLAGRGPSPMVTGRFLEDGPVPVLAAEPERSVIAAGAMQPWKLRGGERPPVLDAAG